MNCNVRHPFWHFIQGLIYWISSFDEAEVFNYHQRQCAAMDGDGDLDVQMIKINRNDLCD